MADNSTQTGADTIRDKDRAGIKTQIVGLDLGIGGTENLMNGSMPVKNAGLTLTSGAIIAATTTVTASTDIPSAGAVLVVIGGTYTGVNVTFEASVDGTTWVTVLGQRTDNFAIEATSGVLPTNQVRAWDFTLPGFQQFRVRATAWATGSAAVAIMPTAAALEVAPTVAIAAASTPTITGVAASATSTTLLAANPARRGAMIVSDPTSAALYIRLGAAVAAATNGNYSVILYGGDTYEIPANYAGEIRGIWATATGFCNVTEIVS